MCIAMDGMMYPIGLNDMLNPVRDILNVLLLIGGFSYGVRYLWKVYSRIALNTTLQLVLLTEIRQALDVWDNSAE